MVACALFTGSPSGLFGTFLCDTERRRNSLKLRDRTESIWTVVLSSKTHFTNPDYKRSEEPLWPSLSPSKVSALTRDARGGRVAGG